MNLKRLRNPLVAALCALLIGGVSVAMATGPSTPSNAPTTTVEEQPGAPDSADGPGGHADDPNDPNADHQFDGEE